MHEISVGSFQCMIQFMLLKNLLNPILKESHSLSMLLLDKGYTGKMGELRKVFGLALITLHDFFLTKIIILF